MEQYLLSRPLQPRLDCLGSRCVMPTHNEKALGTGPGAKSFSLWKETGNHGYSAGKEYYSE